MIRKDLSSKIGPDLSPTTLNWNSAACARRKEMQNEETKPQECAVRWRSAAGRGIFVGPRIEGINVGIDYAVGLPTPFHISLDRNNFDYEYLGGFMLILSTRVPTQGT